MEHEVGKFNSWEIVNENVARKVCDKSFFLHHGSNVAQEIRWFFNAEDLKAGSRIEIVLVYEGFEYDAYVQMETS